MPDVKFGLLNSVYFVTWQTEFYIWYTFCWSGCENISIVLPEVGLLRAETCRSNAVLITWCGQCKCALVGSFMGNINKYSWTLIYVRLLGCIGTTLCKCLVRESNMPAGRYVCCMWLITMYKLLEQSNWRFSGFLQSCRMKADTLGSRSFQLLCTVAGTWRVGNVSHDTEDYNWQFLFFFKKIPH